jgi:hypothetical protein
MRKVAGTNAAAATQQSTTIPKAHMSGIGVLHSGMRESPHDARVAAVNTVASAIGSQTLFRGAGLITSSAGGISGLAWDRPCLDLCDPLVRFGWEAHPGFG